MKSRAGLQATGQLDRCAHGPRAAAATTAPSAMSALTDMSATNAPLAATVGPTSTT
jgi:hypothetical protein